MSPGSSRSLILHWNPLAVALVLLTCLHNAATAPAGPIVATSPDTGNVTVFDPTTLQPITQFPATDGGSGMLNPILWAIFGILLAAPLGVGGVRGGRIATGAAVGFVGVVSVWAAFVNALPMPLAATPNTADLVLTLILVAGFFFFTFLGAFLRFMHPLGLGLLGATGGTSLMIRVVIFKKDLLIPLRVYLVNVALLGVGAVAGGVLIVRKRRVMVILATSLISTFLLGLAVDLILNIKAPPQQGMSRGLRLLLDRNAAHLADIVGTHYEPTIKTQAILGASLALVPVFAYTQHRLFPGPFAYNLTRDNEEDERGGSLYSLGGGVDWAGRPVYTGSNKTRAAQIANSGPVFGAVGQGSRFSV